MSLFRKSPKSPQEVSKALKDALTALERSDKKAEKVKKGGVVKGPVVVGKVLASDSIPDMYR